MVKAGKKYAENRVVLCEMITFLVIIIFIWIDKRFNLTSKLLNMPVLSIGFKEAILRSSLVLLLGVALILVTKKIFSNMKTLEGVLPICASCKRIRDKEEAWHQIEMYIRERSGADFTHGVCPDCAKKLYPEMFEKERRKK